MFRLCITRHVVCLLCSWGHLLLSMHVWAWYLSFEYSLLDRGQHALIEKCHEKLVWGYINKVHTYVSLFELFGFFKDPGKLVNGNRHKICFLDPFVIVWLSIEYASKMDTSKKKQVAHKLTQTPLWSEFTSAHRCWIATNLKSGSLTTTSRENDLGLVVMSRRNGGQARIDGQQWFAICLVRFRRESYKELSIFLLCY